MVAEVVEMPNGWPLGLENMNVRLLGVVESVQAVATEPYSSQLRSTSFSLFTSSDLDTESTKSFYQDRSVSLGRYIKIRLKDRRDFDFTSLNRFEELQGATVRDSPTNPMMKRHEMAVSSQQRFCIPLLKSVLIKSAQVGIVQDIEVLLLNLYALLYKGVLNT